MPFVTVWADVQRLPPATRYLVFAALCWPVLALSYWTDVRLVAWPLEVSGHPAFRDFANFWMGGKAAWSGDFGVLFDRTQHGPEVARMVGIPSSILAWSYPPTALMFFAPFGLLPYGLACAVWTLLGLVVFYAAAGGFGDRRLDWRVLLGLVFVPGVFLCVSYGQTALITSAILWFGLDLARLRPVLAGALLGLFVVKPQLGILLPVALLGLGAWRAILATAVFAAGYLAITFALFGLEPWLLFWTVTLPQQVAWLIGCPIGPQMTELIACPNGPQMILSVLDMLAGLGVPVRLAYGLQFALTLGVMATTFVLMRWEVNPNLRFLGFGAAVMLATPYVLSYELVLIALAVVRVLHDPDAMARLGANAVTGLVIGTTLGMMFLVTMLVRVGVNFASLVFAGILVTVALPQLRPLWRNLGWRLPMRST
jgi:Glycosyltransferase family 87